MSKDFKNDNRDPWDSQTTLSNAEADAALYGAVDIPASGRVIAKPIAISEVWANPAQPRRAVPNSLQLYWNGDPSQVSELLSQWHVIASKKGGQTIDVYAVIQGQGAGYELDDMPAVFTEYIALLRLAASIHQDGLINPITVIKQSDRYMIESGERRWLAYHLLKQYMGDDYNKIPAAKSDGNNYIWRQATENTARRSLNAIGMARQLALLIMEARRDIDGQTYDDFDFMCPPGVCDRRFYAQVANGNVHSIPKGMGEKIQSAMDLSKSHLSNYRGVIKMTDDEGVNDALWIRADVEDWGIKDLLRIKTLSLDVVKPLIQSDDWSLKDLLALKDRFNQLNLETESTLPVEPESGRSMLGLEVETPDGRRGIVTSEHGNDIVIKTQDGMRTMASVDGVSSMSSDKANSQRLSDYYERPKSSSPAPRQPEPQQRRDAFGQDVREDKPNPFGKNVSEHLTGDSKPVFDDYWNGVLAAVATIAAVEGRANVVGRVQRLRSLSKGEARSMDRQAIGSILQSAHDDMTGLLSDIMVSFNQHLDVIADEFMGEVDNEQ